MFVVPLVSRFTKVTQNLQNRVIYTRYHAELMNRFYGGWLGDIIRAVMRQSVIEIVSFNTPHATSSQLSIVTITFVNFAVSGLRFVNCLYTTATSIVHSKLDYCVVSIRSRTLLLVLSLKLLSPVISLTCYALSTGSESLNTP